MTIYVQHNDDKNDSRFFDNQIEQHIYWKIKVESFFSNPAKDLVLPSLISDDHHCQLGYWINSVESNNYKELTHFKNLREIHSEFHHTAEKVMQLIMEGKVDQAEKLKHLFFSQSDQIVDSLNKLKNT